MSSAVPRMLNPAQSGQQAKPILYVLSDCQYMIRAGATCGPTGPGCGLPWANRSACGSGQLAGGCCQPGFACRSSFSWFTLPWFTLPRADHQCRSADRLKLQEKEYADLIGSGKAGRQSQ